MTRKTFGIAVCAIGLVAHGAVNWDDALVVGHTNGDKCFYSAGEEMVFTLELKGVKGEIPPGEYFLDWVRSANDGKTDRGRAEASLGKPLVIRTSLDRPGFVKIEANLVDKTGKRVPKNHMWEKRVFFQGGAGVDVEKLQAWPEPKDFDAHWAAERKIVDDMPLKVIERVQLPCANPGLNLWRMKLNAPKGYLPATGYLVIPKKASAANRMKATGKLSGYYDFPERCPSWLTNHVDGIEMYINRHGCEVDREEGYYKQFYRSWPMPPDHFRGMVFRALQMFRFLKTLPEWNGKDLIAYGTSGGGMQTFWMGALVPGLTRIDCATPALADVYGFKYGRASSALGARVDEINYYDICNFAKRVTCPVTIGAGLGDYTCPPAGIAIVYNNLKGRKQITWSQGCTHGWWPAGMKKVTFKADAQVADKAELARRVAEDVSKPVRPAGVNGQPFWNGASWMFMYPPSFEFKKVPGAAKYRFTAIDDIHRTHTMEAAEPTALLTPMWGEIPARGLVTVICDGVDAKGNVCGRAGMRRFWKSAPFTPGGYKPAPRSYAEAAAKACDFIWSLPNTRYLLEKGEPDPTYGLNCYPAKMSGSVIGIMLDYAKRRPERAKDAIAVARAAADFLLRISQPADAPLAHFPPTYRGTVNTAKQYAGQQMLLYPARVASNYLRLSDVTGDGKYAAAAENIGRTYLKLQGDDGTWHLKLWEKDGKPVVPNRAFPLEPMELFEKLYARTKDPVWRAAADRAFAYIEKGPLTTWNWECQFEDVQPHPPYRALTKHQACSTAIFLLDRFPGDKRRLAQARELLRFAEDQFVYWEKPCRADGTGYRAGTPWPGNICDWNWDYLHWATPGVGEQYGWEMPIDASNSKLIRTYLALYKAEGNPLDLAKARALGDTLVNVQKEDGSIRTQMLMRPDADNFWINCMGASVRVLDMLAETDDLAAKCGAAELTTGENRSEDPHASSAPKAAVPFARPDAMRGPKLRDVRLRGLPAEKMDRFFQARLLSDNARNDIFGEARSAFRARNDDERLVGGRHLGGLWRGEFWGKQMLSAARVADYLQNPSFTSFVREECHRMISLQDKDGYLGSYADKENVWVPPADRPALSAIYGWNTVWNLWNRKYAIWAMLMAYRTTGDKAILDSATRQMDQWIEMMHRLKLPLISTGQPEKVGLPSMSVLKPLLMLYTETGRKAYLDYAKEMLPDWDRADGACPNFYRNANREDPLWKWYPRPDQWGKSYEMMSCLDGILEYARVTGDARSLDTVKAIRENLFRTELNVLGDVGYVDQFFGAANQPNACSELCDTVHWIRLNLDLYLMTGDKRYCDAMEIAYYNAFLAGIFRDGAWAAFAMRGAVRHEHDRQCGYAYNHCCVNNAARTWMDMAEGAVTVDGQGVYHVNFYQDATVALDGVTFEISGGYPVGGTVKVKTSKPVKVAFRKPAWCPKMDVSGSGCEHTLVFDMNPRLLDGPDTVRAEKNTWHYSRYLCRHQSPKDAVCETYRSEPAATIMYGPLLLAKSIRTGATRAELTDMSTVRGKGYSLKLTPSKGDGVWAAWDVELAKPGAPTIKTRACDYQSAGDSPYSSTAVCFSVWF